MLLRERETPQLEGRAERAANHNHLLCTWIDGCTLSQVQLFLFLLCARPNVFTEWGRLEGITAESPGPTSLPKQGPPRGLLRPCLIVVSHTVKCVRQHTLLHLLLHVDLLAATGRNLQLLGEDEFHKAATSD